MLCFCKIFGLFAIFGIFINGSKNETIQFSFIMKSVLPRAQLWKASIMAAESINRNSTLLPDGEIQFNLVDLSVSLDNLRVMAEAMINYPNFAGYIGAYSSGTAILIGNFCNALEIPLLTGTATSPVLSNKSNDGGFPMFTRVNAAGGFYASSLTMIVKMAGWKRIGIISSDTAFGLGLSNDLKRRFTTNNIQLVIHVTHPTILDNSFEIVRESMANGLDELRANGVSIVVYQGLAAALMMSVAYEKNMLGAQSSGTTIQFLLGDAACNTVTFSEANNYCDSKCVSHIEDMKKAMRGTLCAQVKLDLDAGWVDEWDIATSQENLSAQEIQEAGLSDWSGINRYPSAVFYHDVVLANALAIDKLCRKDLKKYGSFQSCYRDLRHRGKDIVKSISELDFQGVSGRIKFNQNQDRFVTMNFMSYHYETSEVFGFEPFGIHDTQTDNVIITADPFFANLQSTPPSDVDETGLSKSFESIIIYIISPLIAVVIFMGLWLIVKHYKQFRGSVFLTVKTSFSLVTVQVCWVFTRLFVDMHTFNPGSMIELMTIMELLSPLLLVAGLSIVLSRVWRFRNVSRNRNCSLIRYSKYHQLLVLICTLVLPTAITIVRCSPIFLNGVSLTSELILQDNAPQKVFHMSKLIYDEILGRQEIILYGVVLLWLYIALLASGIAWLSFRSISKHLQRHKPIVVFELVSMVRLHIVLCVLVLIRGFSDLPLKTGIHEGNVKDYSGFDNGVTDITGNSIRAIVIFKSCVSILMWLAMMYFTLRYNWQFVVNAMPASPVSLRRRSSLHTEMFVNMYDISAEWNLKLRSFFSATPTSANGSSITTTSTTADSCPIGEELTDNRVVFVTDEKLQDTSTPLSISHVQPSTSLCTNGKDPTNPNHHQPTTLGNRVTEANWNDERVVEMFQLLMREGSVLIQEFQVELQNMSGPGIYDAVHRYLKATKIHFIRFPSLCLCCMNCTLQTIFQYICRLQVKT
eukprot:TRINITY_DN740_c0_g1_i2.p1 TRINITY_DN740_c0_g1~~TRINITY_DN740_c0_g1_i2.p1  ORF type:complete len:976 (-),score=88.35 TRINITY_DN740_c0_g1_i2:246-3173(-)